MQYRGVAYTLDRTTSRNTWTWTYQIDSEVKTGRIHTILEVLAVRRLENMIDRDLRRRDRLRHGLAASGN